jgi:hypothetical protein
MARMISKSFGNSVVNVTVNYLKDNTLCEETFVLRGVRSENAIRNEIAKKLETTNFFVKETNKTEGDSETFAMSIDTFISNASECEKDKAYSREFVTLTVKVSTYTIMNSEGINTFVISGVTTERKARKYISDIIGDSNFLIMNCVVSEKRMFMSKEKFIELGIKKSNDNSDDEIADDISEDEIA